MAAPISAVRNGIRQFEEPVFIGGLLLLDRCRGSGRRGGCILGTSLWVVCNPRGWDLFAGHLFREIVSQRVANEVDIGTRMYVLSTACYFRLQLVCECLRAFRVACSLTSPNLHFGVRCQKLFQSFGIALAQTI